ncbi:SRPBCC family protein [Gloeocapsopsis dulcis]|uniref:Cyclase n=1 Tax=Gloeocapsopsis dulcis AAB1 = 1H9 TaxID=1433147 RepID=A0A6N8FRB3_9CHRO|nr:SRPBCC family protein [Gloeocapsopsis dulcis]MUL34895.1 cyclase [Gloeocapsopsis dulcis AAB1 = 1H9]WNN90033.1 SRPBCC family protein [Gloeocapsopsis dulcis]
MVKFKYSSLINAPVEVVWNFHERPDILNLLAPPWQPIQVIRREGGLEVGAISEVKIFVGPVPLKWLAVHTEYHKYHFFTDEQREGPFEYWRHCHQFTAENHKTLLTDDIDFSLPGGFLSDFFASWLVMMQLDPIFRYRHEVTQRECRIHH